MMRSYKKPVELNIQREKICDKCRQPFSTVIESQTTCNSCLIMPTHKIGTFALQPLENIDSQKEESMTKNEESSKTTICVDCQNPFERKGRQIRCDTCNAIKYPYNKRKSSVSKSPESKQPKSNKVKSETLPSFKEFSLVEDNPELLIAFIGAARTVLTKFKAQSMHLEFSDIKLSIEKK